MIKEIIETKLSETFNASDVCHDFVRQALAAGDNIAAIVVAERFLSAI